MIKLSVNDAIGRRLAHDLSRFADTPAECGYSNDRTPFRRGHVVTKDDVPLLLSMGKENLFVLEDVEDEYNSKHSAYTTIESGSISCKRTQQAAVKVHEEAAAARLASLCRNTGIVEAAVKEGKIEMFAGSKGLFRVDTERQRRINSINGIVIATRNSLTAVNGGNGEVGDKLAAVKVIPLEIEDDLLKQAENIAGTSPLFDLLPYVLKTAALVITGNEIKDGRIKDEFAPLVCARLNRLGIELVKKVITGDGCQNIVDGIVQVQSEKPDIILCTGGMSVDPDDNTPAAIIKSGAAVVTYGAPILPGSMFMLAYFNDGTPILGVPGGALYKKDRGGILDIVLPRLAAGIKMTKDDFIVLGNGGLCLSCDVCHYPVCSYGKAVSI
ncbi:MAG: molybdopterin-binding protein [Termitinemataceae bacterium]|nr:MAG: molybdopterin-binding protein [Termitinemataceae bacterium]